MKLIIFFTMIALSFQAQANCDGIAQQEMNACAESHYKNADDILNLVWNSLKSCKVNDPNEWSSIVAAQKVWIEYKEVQCRLEASNDWGFGPFPGSAWPLGYYGCLRQMTEERTQFLQSMNNCN